MNEIKKGDVVTRNSHKNDIMFYVKRVMKLVDGRRIAILKGIDVRVEADAPVDDLKIVNKDEKEKREKELEDKINRRIAKKILKENRKEIIYTGKILHLDGDKKYAEKSMMYYKKIGLKAIVKNIPENKQSKVVYRLLTVYNPDILVITGHDRNDKKQCKIYRYI